MLSCLLYEVGMLWRITQLIFIEKKVENAWIKITYFKWLPWFHIEDFFEYWNIKNHIQCNNNNNNSHYYYYYYYVRLKNCRVHLLLSSASAFSSQYFLLFLKSSRSCILLPATLFTSVICPSMVSRRRQFRLRIWSIQLAILRRILFRNALFSPIDQESVHYSLSFAILSSPFSSSTTFQSSPNTSAPIFLLSRSLSHINPCSKHNT